MSRVDRAETPVRVSILHGRHHLVYRATEQAAAQKPNAIHSPLTCRARARSSSISPNCSIVMVGSATVGLKTSARTSSLRICKFPATREMCVTCTGVDDTIKRFSTCRVEGLSSRKRVREVHTNMHTRIPRLIGACCPRTKQ